jgi:hypothetical protein
MCPNLTKDVQSNDYMEFFFLFSIFWFLLEGRGLVFIIYYGTFVCINLGFEWLVTMLVPRANLMRRVKKLLLVCKCSFTFLCIRFFCVCVCS